MRANAYIGAILPGTLELARQALVGMRQWCERHPQFGINLISEYEQDPRLFKHSPDIRFIGVVAFFLDDEAIDCLQRNFSRNIVCISNRNPLLRVPKVINDDLRIGRVGVDYFYNRGYRTIAFFGSSALEFSNVREAGYRLRVKELGLPCHCFDVGSMDARSIDRILDLDTRTAMVCASDHHARLLIDRLAAPLTTVPSRLAVLGVDNDTFQNSLSPIGLSSIRLSGERIGFEAADLIHRLHRGENAPATPLLIAPQSIVPRRSTDALAIEDALVLRTMRLIQSRIADFPDVFSLLAELNVSRRTLETRFRKATHRSLLNELTDARINKARDLLASTRLSIKEIADLTGIPDQSGFSKVYKRETGETPSAFRERVRPAMS
ncbi:MAG: substrate-binding domain-containing protein [Opitutales bacterium]|nr:substrate-binding domain-containing protein [Opitutales bacterium]